MTTVNIKYHIHTVDDTASDEQFLEFFSISRSKTYPEYVKTNLPLYKVVGSFQTTFTGEKAAEEAFLISDNPSYGETREIVLGHQRSMMVGDIVDVVEENGTITTYICASFGWVELESN